MARPKPLKADSDDMVKAIVFIRGEGAYGFNEYEVPLSMLERYTKPKRTEPDIFAICVSNITKKAREIFGI
jgi:hypothetical protein